MKHIFACQKAMDKYIFQVDQYKQKWPNYCTHCSGWGGFYSRFDPSPKGVSLGSGYMEDFDSCRFCVDEYKCPQCATKNDQWKDGEDLTCKECSWTNELAEGLPSEPECRCEEFCSECERFIGLDIESYEIGICRECAQDPRKSTIREYIDAPGFCPFCKSENISGSNIEIDANSAWQDVGCDDCNKDWRDIYRLVAVSWRRNDDEDRLYSDEHKGII